MCFFIMTVFYRNLFTVLVGGWDDLFCDVNIPFVCARRIRTGTFMFFNSGSVPGLLFYSGILHFLLSANTDPDLN